jgi:hypothetical protein
MPEFNFFCTENDLISILQDALRTGYRIQQKIRLTEPLSKYCETNDEISASVAARGHSYLLENPKFTRYPVSLLKYERDGITFWTARAVKGGPAIAINFFFPYTKEGRSIIPCSLLSFDSVIQNPYTGADERAGDEIKAHFASLVSSFRKTSRRVTSPKKRVAYVSEGADKMLHAGRELAHPFIS